MFVDRYTVVRYSAKERRPCTVAVAGSNSTTIVTNAIQSESQWDPRQGRWWRGWLYRKKDDHSVFVDFTPRGSTAVSQWSSAWRRLYKRCCCVVRVTLRKRGITTRSPVDWHRVTTTWRSSTPTWLSSTPQRRWQLHGQSTPIIIIVIIIISVSSSGGGGGGDLASQCYQLTSNVVSVTAYTDIFISCRRRSSTSPVICVSAAIISPTLHA